MSETFNINTDAIVCITDMNNTHLTLNTNTNFESSLYNIYNDNTLVFIDRMLHSSLTPTLQSAIGALHIDDDLTPQEILAKDIMYVLTDEDFDKEEFLYMANAIKGSIVKNITIDNIITK